MKSVTQRPQRKCINRDQSEHGFQLHQTHRIGHVSPNNWLVPLTSMSSLFRSISALLSSQQLDATNTTTLVLERLYYADGRHDPRHPRHGSFTGLSVL